MSICSCMTGCGRNTMADPGVFGWDCSCWCHDRKPANPYEAARTRLERATKSYQDAKVRAEQILCDAVNELDAAEAGLRQYETSPGIPLPEFREQVAAS